MLYAYHYIACISIQYILKYEEETNLSVTHLRVENPFRWIHYNFNVQKI